MGRSYAGMDYETVVHLFADHITRLCTVWTRDSEAAKDCFQNTFLKLYQSQTEFRDDKHLKAWLITVAKNECRDYHRTFWKRKVELGFEPEEESVMAGCGGEAEQLVYALRDLPLKFREVLVLYYYEGYDTNEIAHMLNASVNTVKSRLRRGREKLAGAIKSQAGKKEEDHGL